MKTQINFKKIEEQVAEVLDQYDHRFTSQGVHEVVQNWFNAKAPLIEILENNPNWDEENLSIVVNTSYTRPCDETIAKNILDELNYATRNKLTEKLRRFKAVLHDRGCERSIDYDCPKWRLIYHGATEQEADEFVEDYNKVLMLDYLGCDLKRICTTGTSQISVEEANILDRYYPIKGIAKVGQKKTRACRAIFKVLEYDQISDYEKYYAKFSDALNEKQYTQKCCISIHPLDYLLMSKGNSWHSCHMIDGGCYQSGSVSYMLDKATIVLYNIETDGDYKGLNALAPKISRNLFMISNNRNMVLQSRCYPNNRDYVRDQNRTFFQEQWALSLGISNEWVKFSLASDSLRYYIDRQRGATNYEDYYSSEYRTLFRIKGNTISTISNVDDGDKLPIGECPMCFNCGQQNPSCVINDELICDECI